MPKLSIFLNKKTLKRRLPPFDLECAPWNDPDLYLDWSMHLIKMNIFTVGFTKISYKILKLW